MFFDTPTTPKIGIGHHLCSFPLKLTQIILQILMRLHLGVISQCATAEVAEHIRSGRKQGTQANTAERVASFGSRH